MGVGDGWGRRLLISVAMATYNGERFIEEQLSSLAHQTLLPTQLVVTDDCSCDRTLSAIERFASTSSFQVVVQRNDERRGYVKTFERSIARCEGELIALCDQDDVWLPEKLTRSVTAFQDPDVGFVFGDALLVDVDLQTLGESLWRFGGFDEARQQLAVTQGLFSLLVGRPLVNGPTLVFKSALKSIVLPIPDGCTAHDDWIALGASFVSRGVAIDKPLIKYRIHEGQAVGVVGGPQAVMGRPRGPNPVRWRREAHRHVLAIRDERIRARVNLLQCLTERAEGLPVNRERLDSMLSDLFLRAEHYRIRSQLPTSRAGRVLPVLHELTQRRYGRYSGGLLSAAKDLVL